ncbi:MAG: PRC-barrel domain-containing protein [Candidatus Aenigmatarchaeota archaeon]|nr:MAG: PRC-barrel domain-containing protein [Candidatus Aenigmarchaeota archaeon]
MAIQVSSISDTYSKDVFTDRGFFCGKVEDVECDLKRFKIRSLVIRAIKGSYLSKMLGDKKGVVIPFPMVHAVGDIILIKHISAPTAEETTSLPESGPEAA